MGKTGVHADAALDIGGNAENLLRLAPCHLWLGQTTFTPSLDVVAEETIAWSEEADAYFARAPEFVREMARKAVLRFAHERGHTFITLDFVEEVAKRFMGGGDPAADPGTSGPLRWSDEATGLLAREPNAAVAGNVRLRAEKRARRQSSDEVLAEHVQPFLDDQGRPTPPWSAAALARLARVPEMIRDVVATRIEASARDRGAAEITLEIAEQAIAETRRAMCPVQEDTQEGTPEDPGSDGSGRGGT
jgi:hypothetical protein